MFRKFRDLFVSGGTLVQGDINVMTHTTYHNTSRIGPRDLLLGHTSPNAIHDSKELERQGICLENTREAILKLLHDYLSSSTLESPGVLWVNGPAGVGKSAIARTIAQSASEAGTLLASFFFYSSDATRNTLDPFIPTLAVQICRRFPQARTHIEQAIENDPLIFTKGTAAQANALLVRPLARVLPNVSSLGSTPLSIIVDGLDESADSERQIEAINVLLAIVARVHTATRVRLKVVLFSRPERWIKDRIARYQQVGQVTSVALEGDLSPRSDIKLYYAVHLEKIREDHPAGPFLEADWPGPQQMKELIDITDNHFAFAHTMRIFVADPQEDPRRQLDIILGLTQPSRDSPHAHIDQLFAAIFSRVPRHLLTLTLRVIGSILVPSPCALDSSPGLLELVFSLKRGQLQQMFFHLESLFDLGNRSSSWIRVHHKTLADFLFTPSRSKQYDLLIDQDVVYEDIRQSVQSVFLRQVVPEHKGTTSFVQFLYRLSKLSIDMSPPQWTLDNLPSPKFAQGENVPTASAWEPWAVLIGGYYNDLPILRSLAVPSWHNYVAVQQTRMKDGSRNPMRTLAVYDSSALGRFCLVHAEMGVWQMYDERQLVFYQAFIRHAIRSQPGLLESDNTVGWNLVNCDPNNLAEVAAYFMSRPMSYRSKLMMQVVRDTFDPNWAISRLGMLLSWHEGGHRSSDNPWEHAARGELVEVAGESQHQCSMCSKVLDICKAEVIGYCLEWIRPNSLFYQAVFDHIRTRSLFWNHSDLFYLWTKALQQNEELIASDPHLTGITESVREQDVFLDQADAERKRLLMLDGWDEGSAFRMVTYPYSRACIPFTPSDEHAIRVSKRRAAWYNGTELPEVVYTYPEAH